MQPNPISSILNFNPSAPESRSVSETHWDSGVGRMSHTVIAPKIKSMAATASHEMLMLYAGPAISHDRAANTYFMITTPPAHTLPPIESRVNRKSPGRIA